MGEPHHQGDLPAGIPGKLGFQSPGRIQTVELGGTITGESVGQTPGDKHREESLH